MMTAKERWLAAIQLQPVDRLPFWPKLDGAYPGAQAPPFCDMKVDEIHDWIGSDKHIGISGCIKEIRRNTSVEIRTDNGIQRTFFHTQLGSAEMVKKSPLLKGVRGLYVTSQSWHPIEFPVKNIDDVKLMTEWYSDCQIELNKDGLDQARAQAKSIGSDAVTCNGIGESPLMHWVEWLAGIENAHYLLADYPQEVEKLFEVIHQSLLRKTEILTENSPCDIFYLVENTSTTLISPEQYRKYCFRHIQEYGKIARSAGRLLLLHMCGHLKALLPDLSKLPVDGFEAFTSPTLGNTSLLDGRTACPDKCLIGGTNAMLWTRTTEEIISKIEVDLDVLPHHRGLVVTSAGVMPPMCKPETIKSVCGWVKEYEARM
jgi:uroporphyrinogen-III decarboxylase